VRKDVTRPITFRYATAINEDYSRSTDRFSGRLNGGGRLCDGRELKTPADDADVDPPAEVFSRP